MSKYRFKTKEEFIKDGLWDSFGNTPIHWASSGNMNKYLGIDISDDFIKDIEKYESFYINLWTFRANNCILKTPVIKFNKGDSIKVVSTIASYKEWTKIGKIDVTFNVGDILTVEKVTEYSLQIVKYGGWYPLSMFEKYDKPIKEYTVKDFIVGQSVKVIATEASQVHWQAVGKIKFPYSKGDILVIKNITKGLNFTCSKIYSYPACMFEPLSIEKSVIKDDFFDDVVSAPESLRGKYIKVVKSTFRENLPIGFSDKIINDDIGFIYIESNPKDCITKDSIKKGELIISDYPFLCDTTISKDIVDSFSNTVDFSEKSSNSCSEVAMLITESHESYLDSSKKTIPNPREIILIKPISIKKRLKL